MQDPMRLCRPMHIAFPLLCAGFTLTSCAGGASFDKISNGAPQDLRRVTAQTDPCLQIWIDNAGPEQSVDAADALAATCDVLHDPKFKLALDALTESWVTGQENDETSVAPNSVLPLVVGLANTPIHLILGPVSSANATSLLAVSEVTKVPAKVVGDLRRSRE